MTRHLSNTRLLAVMLLLAVTGLVACQTDLSPDSAWNPISGQTGQENSQAALRGKGIAVEQTEIQACNGVIHVIDLALLHPAVERMVLEQTEGFDPAAYQPSPEVLAAEQAQQDQVTICHATASETNPYNELTIAESGLNGHANHAEDYIPSAGAGCLGAPPTAEPQSDAGVSVETAACAEGTTIADLLQADGRFTTFVELLDREGLLATLDEPGPFTVFAPTDAAFRALPGDVLEQWRSDDALLSTELLYHVVQGQFMLSDFQTTTTVTTLNDATITITVVNNTIYLERPLEMAQPTQEGPTATVPPGITPTPTSTDEGVDEDGDQADNVTICHQTHSRRNPYNRITVDESALSAHAAHGDIIPAPEGGCPAGDRGQLRGHGRGRGHGNGGGNGNGNGNGGGD